MSGGLLQEVAQWINDQGCNGYKNVKSAKIRKLMQCPYCISGQLSLIATLFHLVFVGFELELLLSVPLSINLTYILYHNLYE